MNQLFANILNWIAGIIGNYGWAMVIFTIFVKLLVMPLSFNSRKSMRKMAALQPEITKLQKRYANDQQKMNMKMQALYQKEKVSPMSGCLPMIISMVILIIMFNAMRLVANQNLAAQTLELLATGKQTNESWLWIKNLWMPDTPFVPFVADKQQTLNLITAEVWQGALAKITDPAQISALSGLNLTADTITGDAVFAALQASEAWKAHQTLAMSIPTGLFGTWNIFRDHNGLFILPVLACVTQFLMSMSQNQQQPQTENSAAGSGKFMKYFFPLITLFFCFSYNAAFALYWVVSNIYAWVENTVFNLVLDKKEKKESAVIEEDSIK